MSSGPCETAQCPDESLRRLLRRCTLVLLLLGLAWRGCRYFVQFPIWGDEAFVCLNLPQQTYLGLIGHLQCHQIVPVLCLWSELTVYRLLGASELALRLLPFLAGTGALLLFWRLARRTLPPLAATLAVGILAVSYFPVRHACEVKPYAADLFFAAALMFLAVRWLDEPGRLRWLVLLALVGPVAVLGSYPAVFVVGAVSLALLPAVARQPGPAARRLYIACNSLAAAAFVFTLIVGKHQSGPVTAFYNEYWAEGFPPLQPLGFVKWFFLSHTGMMLAYPVGDANGASALTFILCVIGAWQLERTGRWSLLVLCLAPFGLGILAAMLHRYPYGTAARLAQHLAPAVCLLAGLGGACVIEWAGRTLAAQRRWVLGTCAALALLPAVGMVRDLVLPAKTEADLWRYQVVRELIAEGSPTEPIVVLRKPEDVDSAMRWYLTCQGNRVCWNGRVDWQKLDPTVDRMLVFSYSCGSPTRGDFPICPPSVRSDWVEREHQPRSYVPKNPHYATEYCDIYVWERPEGETEY